MGVDAVRNEAARFSNGAGPGRLRVRPLAARCLAVAVLVAFAALLALPVQAQTPDEDADAPQSTDPLEDTQTPDEGADASQVTDPRAETQTVRTAHTAEDVEDVPLDWGLIPSSLGPGDEFRLLFLSSAVRAATSNQISDYNTFIQDLAAAGHADIQAYSSGFRVLGCTFRVDARDNTDTTYTDSDKGVPIYWLNGLEVADDYEDFYDGSWYNEYWNNNEFGAYGRDTDVSENQPFTGCYHAGTGVTDGSFRTLGTASGSVRIGRPATSTSDAGPINGVAETLAVNLRPLYGLSKVFHVGSREATLETLRVSGTGGNKLSPRFRPRREDFALSVGEGVEQITIHATPRHSGATYRIFLVGQKDAVDLDPNLAGFQIRLKGGPLTNIRVQVTAEDSKTRRTYSVAVTREPRAVPVDWSLIPAGLTTGDEFRLLFLSSTKRDSRPKEIVTFDRFIQGLAGAGHPDIQAYKEGFKVVGCTELVDANEHTGTFYNSVSPGVPIYWLNGNKVADDYEDFYDGNWDDEANDKNEFGEDGFDTSLENNYPYTGCDHDGTESPITIGLRNALGFPFTRVGQPNDSAANAGPLSSDNTAPGQNPPPETVNHPFYGLSETFVVGSTDDDLTDLELQGPDGAEIALTPTFATGTLAYTASVANSVDVVTVIPTFSHSHATFEIEDGSGTELDDVDSNADGFQVVLPYYMANTINVVVTAQDVAYTQTYTVVVTRDRALFPESSSLLPTGLVHGDLFRLLFLSSTKRDGLSSDIADYNNFIQDLVASGHTDIQAYSSGFRVVGCTGLVDARDNTETTYTSSDKGVPIYWLGGSKAADDYEDFYDGTWDDEVNDKNQSGDNGPDTSLVANYPLTGCDDDGTEASALGGSLALGNTASVAIVRVGRLNSSTSGEGPIEGGTQAAFSSDTRPFYGLSEVYEVVSSDATLIDLAVKDDADADVPLSSAFTPERTNYVGRVGTSVGEVTVIPTVNDSHATYRFVKQYTRRSFSDSNLNKNGFQRAIVKGVTTTDVEVTAADGSTRSYRVVIRRGPTTVPDIWSLTPTGLVADDLFRLLFISSTTRDGSSSVIEDYNTFIQGLAAAGHTDIQAYSPGFRVVGCTDADDARDNTETTYTSSDKGVPIYWLGATKAADDYEDFYDGSWDDEANDKDESGANGPDTSVFANHPFTGCEDDGTEAFNSAVSLALGNPTGFVRIGSPGGGSGPISGAFNPPSTDSRPFYGLSEVFRVVSTDATLSDLAVEDNAGAAITLTPTFTSTTTYYTAFAANSVDEVTVIPTVNEGNATYEILDGSGTVLVDADLNKADFQVALSEGANTFKVEVTAQDEAYIQTYTVVVTRTSPVTISADGTSAIYGEDGVDFTLTRFGSVDGYLVVPVNLTQTDDYLSASSLSETVVFAPGSATAELEIQDSQFRRLAAGTAVKNGTLTATVGDGVGYTVGTPNSATVDIIIAATIGFEKLSYTVSEEAGIPLTVTVVVRTGEGAPQPDATISVGLGTFMVGSATVPEDYHTLSEDLDFSPSDFAAVGTVYEARKSFYVAIVNDDIADSGETFLIRLQLTPGLLEKYRYNFADSAGNRCGTTCVVTATITDADLGVTVSKAALAVAEGDVTGDSYTVVLDTQPTADVTVTVAGHAGTDVTPTPATLTFTSTTWATAQAVNVTAGEDSDNVNDTVSLTHSATSTDSDYDAITIAGVVVTVIDNGDGPGVTVSKSALTVTEGDVTGDSYTVILNTQPTADVTVTVAGHAGTDVTPTPATLTFTSTTWATEQTVTVTAGEDDDEIDDTVLLTRRATSADSAYDAITIADVTVTVIDNDRPVVTVSADMAEANGNLHRVMFDLPWPSYTVTRTGSAARSLTVDLNVPSNPYTSQSLFTVTIPPGARSAQLEFDDSYFNQASVAGTLTVEVVESASFVVGTQASASISITRTTPAITLEIEDGTSFDVSEGAGTGTFTVVARTAAGLPEPSRGWETEAGFGLSWGLETVPGSLGATAGTDFVEFTGVSPVTGSWVANDDHFLHVSTYDLEILDDMIAEPEEGLSLRLGTSTLPLLWGSYLDLNCPDVTCEYTVTIIDDDTAGASVSMTALTVTEEDTTGQTYTVALNSQPTANVVVTVAGHTGTDVTPNPASLTFTPMNWATAQTVMVTAGDDADSMNDLVSLIHSASSTDSFYAGVPIAGVAVTVNDDDPNSVGVEILTPEVTEGQYIRYRFFHDGSAGRNITINVRRSEEGSAVLDTATGDSMWTFTGGVTELPASTLSEARDGNDGDATFTVEILPGQGYVINPSYATGQAIVRDADPPPVLGFRDLAVVGKEGDGTMEFWVDLVSPLPSLRTVTVDYAVRENDTVDGADIVASSGTLTFAPGETEAIIQVPVLQDLIAETDEAFTVELTNPVYATLEYGHASLSAQGTIEDDEPTVSVETAVSVVDEGESVLFTLTRTGDATGELDVWLRVIRTQRLGEVTFPAVTFSAGTSTVTYTITTEDDDEALGSYDLIIGIAHPVNDIGGLNTYWGAPEESTVIVRDGELPTVWIETIDPDGAPGHGNPYPNVQIPRNITEGEEMFFILKQNYRADEIIINLEGTGGEGFVRGMVPTTVTMAGGERSKRFSVRTRNDLVAEEHGEFTMTVLDGTAYRPGDDGGRRQSASYWIYDNDTIGLPSLRISSNDDWVNEGEDVVFTLTRSNSAGSLDAYVRIITTRASPSGSASVQEVEDATVTFAEGSATTTVTIATTNDLVNGGDRHVVATIRPGLYRLMTIGQGASYDIVWVQDDDRPTVTLTPATDTFVEGEAQEITLNRAGDATYFMRFKTRVETTVHHPDPSREATSSYVHPFSFLIEGESSGTRRIRTAPRVDALGASGSIQLLPVDCSDSPGFGNVGCSLTLQYLLGSQIEQTYAIYSDFMGVRIEADQPSVGEGGTVTFTLERQGGNPSQLDDPLYVTVMVTQDGNFILGTAPQSVTFAAGQTTATLSVPTSDDTTDEADGSITVTLVRPISFTDEQYAYAIGEYSGTPWAVTEVTTEVTDDDYSLPAISVGDSSALETDGTIEFTVSLDRANYERAASVAWATADDASTTSATSGIDYTAASGVLNFAIGETEKTVTVALMDDHLDEADETFSVVLSSPVEVTLGDGTGTGTIRDDERARAVIIWSSSLDNEEGDKVTVNFRRLMAVDPNGGATCYADLPDHCYDADADPGNVPLTVNVMATQQGDFISGSIPTTVTFGPGDTFATLDIETEDDNVVEATGIITVEVLGGAGYVPLATGAGQGQLMTNPSRDLNVYDNDLIISIDDAQANEDAGPMDFTVRLNAPAPDGVTVGVVTLEGDATSSGTVTPISLGADFHARSETLTFEVGDQQKIFSLNLVDDRIQERSETLTVQLILPVRPLSMLSDDTAIGTIVDNEAAMVASVSRTFAVVDEHHAGPALFAVELTHPDTVNHELNPAVGRRVTAGTATAGDDYQAIGGKLTFPVGSTSDSLEVNIHDDSLLEELLETFTVELVEQGSSLLTLSPTEGSFDASIRDNETLTSSISANSDSVAEGQDAVFTVTLAGGVTTQAVSVELMTSGTATAVDDYGTPTGSLTFPEGDTSGKAATLEIPAGQSQGTITYPILTDIVAEGTETLNVELINATSGLRTIPVLPAGSVATTEIVPQGSLIISISGSPTVVEGAAATFTITMTKTHTQNVSVEWATSEGGTALVDDDYTAATGTVAIPAGSTSATFTVSTKEDTLAEENETFHVRLVEATVTDSSPAEILLLGMSVDQGTISDNDTAPTAFTFTVSPNEVVETAGATELTVTVTLEGATQFPTATPVTVEMIDHPDAQNSATLGVDYTANTANTAIPAGESSVTTILTLTPVDDDCAEGDEVARLSVKSSVLDDPDGQNVTIKDNDNTGCEINLNVRPDRVDESASLAQLTITATMRGEAIQPVDTVINLSLVNGTANVGDDFEPATASLTIPAGETEATAVLSLEVLEDNVAEGDESLQVAGSVEGNLRVLPAEVVIVDNDLEPSSIAISVTSALLYEGGGAVTIPVQVGFLGDSTRAVETQVALDIVGLTATLAEDYTASWDSSNVTIPAGAFSAVANLTLVIEDDTLFEGAEQIAVRGSNADPGLTVNGVLLTIVDNDSQPTTITLSLDVTELSEGQVFDFPNIYATLEGSSTLEFDVDISITLANLTQVNSAYGGALRGPLRILAGHSQGTTKVSLLNIDDDVEDADETIEFRGMADNPNLTVNPVQLVLANDDFSGVTVTPTSLAVAEGSSHTYTVVLDSQPAGDVTVTVNDPTDNTDVTADPASLTFTVLDWETAQTVTVSASQDDNGDNETATVTHTVAGYGTVTTADAVTVTVQDDAPGALTVSFEESSHTVAEGATTTITVKLDADPERTIVVPLTHEGQGGATTTDYSGVPEEVTFNSGDTEKSFIFSATQDSVDDDGESVKLTFGTLPTGVSEGTTSETVVSITDDDTAGVTVSETALTIQEGNTDTYTVVLDTEPPGNVTVTITDPTDNTDVTADPASLTFTVLDWEIAQTVTVSASQDDNGDNETATVTHTVTGYGTVTTADAVTVTVEDDAPGALTVSFEESSHTVAEGATTTITVKLDLDPERTIVVPLTHEGQGGATTTDYSGVPEEVTFNSGDTEISFIFTTTQDTVDDDGESVKLTFGTLPTGVSEGTTNETVVTITDNDDPQVTVSFEQSTYTVAEGSSATIKVKLNADPERTVTIQITRDDLGGATVHRLQRRARERGLQQWRHGEDLLLQRCQRQ